jgi:putative intracellular protease/amidase
MNIITPFLFSTLLTVSAVAKENVLFVLTAADKQVLQNGKVRDTGLFLGEFYIPYRDLISKGHQVSFATIDAKPAPVDPESLNPDYWKDHSLIQEAVKFTKTNKDFLNPQSLKYVVGNLNKYDAIVIPGGQGVMVDLIENDTITEILKDFALKKKPIGLICHSPALLVNLAKLDKNPLAGFDVTSVSILEELYIENFIMKGKAKHRMIRFQLENSGYDAHSSLPKWSHVEKDRFLVTNQNPFSSEEFSEVFLETLWEYSKKE